MSKSLILTTVPTKDSEAGAWLEWYKLLKRNLPNRDAKSIWVKAWAKRKSDKANTAKLRAEMDKEGINLNEGGILEKAGDWAQGAETFVGRTLKVGQYAGFAVGGIIILGAAVLIWGIVKNPIASARAGADLAGSVYTKGAVRVK